MKTKFTTIFILLLLYSSKAQVSTDERENKATRIRCKVRTLTIYQADYQAVLGVWQLGQQYKVAKYKYDRQGEVTDEISFNKRGTIESWVGNKTGKDGRTIYTTYNSDGTAHHTNYAVYKNDSLGRLQLTLLYRQDDVLITKVQNFYDSVGNVEQVETYVLVGDKGDLYLDSFQKNFFDAKGRTVRIEYYNSHGEYRNREEFKYDAKGQLIEKTDYYANTYKYNPCGLQTEVKAYGGANGDKPAAVYKMVYEYHQ